MKRVKLAVFLIFFGVSAYARGSIGNGDSITIEKTVSPFDKIQISGKADVNYYMGQEYRAVITIDSNLEDRLDIYSRNRTLNIGMKPGTVSYTVLKVDVYCPELAGVSISGASDFKAVDKITTKSFWLSVSGAGSINGSFECERFQADMSGSGDFSGSVACDSFSVDFSGSGKITLEGTGKEAVVSMSGAGVYNGREFRTERTSLKASGSGKMNVWATEQLEADISGAVLVKYRGNPKLSYRSSGAGRLENEQ